MREGLRDPSGGGSRDPWGTHPGEPPRLRNCPSDARRARQRRPRPGSGAAGRTRRRRQRPAAALSCSVAAGAVRVLAGAHMLAQAEPAALAGAHSALLVHSICGRRDEFAGSPRGSGRAVAPRPGRCLGRPGRSRARNAGTGAPPRRRSGSRRGRCSALPSWRRPRPQTRRPQHGRWTTGVMAAGFLLAEPLEQ